MIEKKGYYNKGELLERKKYYRPKIDELEIKRQHLSSELKEVKRKLTLYK
jgi:hypothetical protein